VDAIRENLLAWALHFAARGWHVFPIAPGAKNHRASTGGRPGQHRPRPDQPPELPPDEQDTTTTTTTTVVVAQWEFTDPPLHRSTST
jgi:hypothetical protein